MPSLLKRIGLLLALVLLASTRASAHSMPQSLVQLDFLRDTVAVELTLPMNELELSFKQPLMAAPEQVVERYSSSLRPYILGHIQAIAPDGRAWTVEVQDLGFKPAEAGREFSVPDVIARLVMRPPLGAPLREFTLNYSVIGHEVMSHIALVSVRHDWNTGTVASKPESLGAIQFTVTSIKIDRTRATFWQGFNSIFALGMHHIAGGLDHLLFLLVLLLPAPLLVEARRWGAYGGAKRGGIQLLKVVTAFTIGHSLTLLIAALGWLRLPVKPVEVLIAASILVSAIHAVRPWFAGREAWIAGGFGLIHGLAFASGISEFGFSPWHMLMTVLAFNLGIEVMQLAIVLAIVPILFLLARTPAYRGLRLAGAAASAIAALFWIAQRLTQ
jgi:hypothetical protein